MFHERAARETGIVLLVYVRDLVAFQPISNGVHASAVCA